MIYQILVSNFVNQDLPFALLNNKSWKLFHYIYIYIYIYIVYYVAEYACRVYTMVYSILCIKACVYGCVCVWWINRLTRKDLMRRKVNNFSPKLSRAHCKYTDDISETSQ
jgi:membrane associated rhomboid family serine protease